MLLVCNWCVLGAQDPAPFAVELPRGPGGFGFSLRGGPAGVFVRGLREGGPAQRCGCIQVQGGFGGAAGLLGEEMGAWGQKGLWGNWGEGSNRGWGAIWGRGGSEVLGGFCQELGGLGGTVEVLRATGGLGGFMGVLGAAGGWERWFGGNMGSLVGSNEGAGESKEGSLGRL